MTADRVLVENATCLGCGCACDDIAVVVEHGRIVEARNACALGVEWFGDGQVPSRILVAGRDATLQEAVSATGELLTGAMSPLVYLAPDISCEAQGDAVAIADLLRATLDTVTTATALPSILAAQERGFAAATLGEIRNRADVVVFWGVDTARRYPRFATRYAPEPAGLHVPSGRQSRIVIAVDVGPSTGPADADRRIAVDAADELATLTALGELVSTGNREMESSGNAETERAPVTGPAWDNARALAPPLLAGRYVALVYDAEPPDTDASSRSIQRFDALTSLAQSLNDRTRCAAIALRAGGNRSGADAVLTAQTGYPLAVDFTRGHPRYRPHDASALTRVTRGEIDVALVLGAVALVPPDVVAALANVRCAAIGPAASTSALGSALVVIDTGVAGIHSGGTALRTDDVPLPLRPSVPGPPSAAEIAQALTASIRAMTPVA